MANGKDATTSSPLIPGHSVPQAWPSMSEQEKETCVSSATSICKDLAS